MQEDISIGKGKKEIFKSCIVAFSLCCFIYIVYASPLGKWLNADYLNDLKSRLQYWYIVGPLIFWIVGTLAISSGIPRTMIGLLGGTIFGFWEGIVVVEVVCLTGGLITLLYSRWARQTFMSRFERKLAILNEYTEKQGFVTTILLRQMPIPGIMVNVLLGISRIRIKTFIAASAIGFLPQNIIFTLYGTGLQNHSLSYAAIASSCLIIFSILVYLLYCYCGSIRTLMSKFQELKRG